jgi:hypothetical protein
MVGLIILRHRLATVSVTSQVLKSYLAYSAMRFTKSWSSVDAS